VLVLIAIASFEEAIAEIIAPKDLQSNPLAFREGVAAIRKG